MKKRKTLYLLIVLFLCFAFISPSSAATSKVSVIYKGKTKTYSKMKKYAYVNGKKKSLKNVPTFQKSQWYMGPSVELLRDSALKVKMTTTSKTITLSYNGNVLKMTDGKATAYLNKKKVNVGTYPFKVKYKASGRTRWVVPMKTVCKFLGIQYKVSSQVVKLTGIKNTGKATTTTQKATTSTQKATTSTQKATTSTQKATTATTQKSTSATTATKGGKVVLCLDAGHGGKDSGAPGAKYLEKNLALAILKAAKKKFDADSRFQVYYTRTTDTYPSLTERYELANKKNADLFISIHINSADSKVATGTETLYNASRCSATKKNGVTSKMLATAMQKATQSATGFRNRGLVERSDLRILNHSKMPACLLEYGFISTAKEEITMYNNTTKYGYALYNAVDNFCKTNNLY